MGSSKVLNNYVLELKTPNTSSNVCLVFERQIVEGIPIFQKIYICLTTIKGGFIAGCRRVIGLDGCFLEELLKGQQLVAVDKMGAIKCSLWHGKLLKRKTMKVGHGLWKPKV